MENNAYPVSFTSMDDVKYVIENFDKEIWEEDMKDLVSRTNGFVIIGKNPKVNHHQKITCEPVFLQEVADLQEKASEWSDVTPLGDYDDTDLGTFECDGVLYLAQFGKLPYAILPWLDIDYVLNHLYGFSDAIEQLENQAKEIKDQMKDMKWVDDEGREVDENDNVIKKMIDINAEDPFEGLSAAELFRLSPILKAHIELISSTTEKENDEEEL